MANGLNAQLSEQKSTLKGPACIAASMPDLPYLVNGDPTHNTIRKTCPNDIRQSQNLSAAEASNFARLLKKHRGLEACFSARRYSDSPTVVRDVAA